MASDLRLRRTLTLRAHDGERLRKLVLTKKRGESIEHVWMKATIWALYLPEYPEMSVEVSIGDAFKPDLVHMAPPPGGLAYGDPEPVFWGEAGKVSERKWRSLFKRFPRTHFVIAKWGRAASLRTHASLLRRALGSRPRLAPLDVLAVPPGVERLIAPDGTLGVSWDTIPRQRLAG